MSQQLIGLTSHHTHRLTTHKGLIIIVVDAGRTRHHQLVRLHRRLRALSNVTTLLGQGCRRPNHRGQVVLDFLFRLPANKAMIGRLGSS